MNKFMKKLWAKKESKKGFTLVELIVVLVILAILAAILVPSLIGWINRAKQQQGVLEARNAYLATQTIVFESNVKTPITEVSAKDQGLSDFGTGAETEFTQLTGRQASYVVSFKHDSTGVITDFVYDNGEIHAVYANDAWTITDSTT